MFRAFPKKKGRTFKYRAYSLRLFKRMSKSERFILRNNKKSSAKILVHQLAYAEDEELLDKLEAKLFECETVKQKFGYLD